MYSPMKRVPSLAASLLLMLFAIAIAIAAGAPARTLAGTAQQAPTALP